MDSTFEIAHLKFRAAEIKELLEIKERRIREFEEKEQEHGEKNREKNPRTTLQQPCNSLST